MAVGASQPLLDRFVSSSVAKPISITVSDTVHVSGWLQNPAHARACYVLAHGAGAGSAHCATSFLIWNVTPGDPIRRGWRKQRSGPPWLQRWICFPNIRSLLGANPLAAGVCGLAFLGFPLHPAGRPSQERAAHLFDVQIPM